MNQREKIKQYFDVSKDEQAFRLINLVNDEIIHEAVILLNESENNELQDVLKRTDDYKEIENFLREKISNFDDLVDYAMKKIKRLYSIN